MTEILARRINTHVSRLNRFLPFSASHDQIYEEYQTGDDSLDLSTVAIDYAERALREGAKCIVLTGDAGHGKTHMCRRLIERVLGYGGDEARKILVTRCDGSKSIPSVDGELNVRIHKDFSELEPGSAAALLELVPDRPAETLIVCANEGRLRAVVGSSAAGPLCEKLVELFKQSFLTGKCSLDGGIHIINLNYQSVAATSGPIATSLVRRTLQRWAGDGRSWGSGACGSCSASKNCPVRRNRTMLAAEGDVTDRRIAKLEKLCEVVERLGHVITIREMLMLIAYLVTGGLSCEDVHRRSSKADGQPGWQHAWAFYNLLFQSPPGTPEDRVYKGIPVLAVFRRLDPGVIASRGVDDEVLNIGNVFPEGELDLQYRIGGTGNLKLVDAAMGVDDFMGNPQSRADQAREAAVTSKAIKALRRRALFDDQSSRGTLMVRLGFRHGDAFLGMLENRLSPAERVKLKNIVIAGLHALQGLRMSKTETTLHLVDPAFGRASADAAIIARRIPTAQLLLLPAQNAWEAHEKSWTLCKSVDWIDRAVVVRVQERSGSHTDISLDLLSFECVTRSASGYVSEDFYSHEIRRIRAFLGRLAAGGRIDGGEISLFTGGSVQNVSLDMGVIQVGGL